ncbi:MAG: hypothetical protein RMI99_04250 [Nitrososphaerota archaeon]|nr:hypothetical protein [Candidatus Nezhaarchaeota archaeon]MDW8050255.1 hypothetical protein [Nitrososphaerota archaeon]
MVSMNELGKLFLCSSLLEEKVAKAYEHMSQLFDNKLIKCLLEFIARDSYKHARCFELMAKAFSQEVHVNPEDCVKVWGKTWLAAIKSADRILKKHEIGLSDIDSLLDELREIEGFTAEEFLTVLHVKTIDLMASEGEVHLDHFKVILNWIAEDEKRHEKIIEIVKSMILRIVS